MSHGFLNELKR